VESTTAGDFVIRPEATEGPDGTWHADVVLFCVKGYDNDLAVEVMGPAVGEGTSILTLQNGIGSGDALAAAFGREKVLLGVTYVDATRTAPGIVVEDGAQANIVFGEENGRRSERAVEVYEAIAAAGIDVTLSPNIRIELWTKLVYICALSGMSCITDSTFAEVVATPETLSLTERVMQEVDSVARAMEIGLDDQIVRSTMTRFVESKGTGTSSMHTDLKRGNPLEVSVLNGAVSRLGKQHGVQTPVNDFITACLTPAHNRAMAERAQQY
jgi:2-dehydropantoate 2-reductase